MNYLEYQETTRPRRINKQDNDYWNSGLLACGQIASPLKRRVETGQGHIPKPPKWYVTKITSPLEWPADRQKQASNHRSGRPAREAMPRLTYKKKDLRLWIHRTPAMPCIWPRTMHSRSWPEEFVWVIKNDNEFIWFIKNFYELLRIWQSGHGKQRCVSIVRSKRWPTESDAQYGKPYWD